jgi:hypothetical protein
MVKKIAIIQSNYIPWKGYFDIMNMADEFILYDDAQYTRRDWRNRNKIKCQNGIRWLSIPVEAKSNFYSKIKEMKIADKKWGAQHWKTIAHNYARAAYFRAYDEIFEELYLNTAEVYLSEINYKFIRKINEILGINTKISWSWDYKFEGSKTEKLLSLCKSAGATEYISGPTAKDYLNDELFKKENIKLAWMDYSNYPEYRQLYPPFEHQVSIIDLIFNAGPGAIKYMKSFFGIKTPRHPREMGAVI